MSSSFWKVPRSNLQWVRQWCRRVSHPMPFILQEVNTRMLARAQIMRPTQGGVIHHGWVHPAGLMPLQALFGDRSIAVCVPVLDPFAVGLPKPKGVLSRLFSWEKARALNVMPVWPQEALPFESETQALVWSPLWLHHVEDPQVQLQAWLRVLKPEGCVFLTCFGPDTAKELQAVAVSLGLVLPDFPDMHDWGDLLGNNGFSDPVVEMEKLTLTYSSPEALLDDWRALVGRNVLTGPKGLFGREAKQKVLLVLESQRDTGTGRIALTLELVYAHAWKVKKQAKPAFASVRLDDIGGRKANRLPDGLKR